MALGSTKDPVPINKVECDGEGWDFIFGPPWAYAHTCVPMHMKTHIIHTCIHAIQTWKRKAQTINFSDAMAYMFSSQTFYGGLYITQTPAFFPLTESHILDRVTKDRAMQGGPERRERKAER